MCKILAPQREEVKRGWRKLYSEQLCEFYQTILLLLLSSLSLLGLIYQGE